MIEDTEVSLTAGVGAALLAFCADPGIQSVFPKQTGKDGGLHSKILGELSQVLYR